MTFKNRYTHIIFKTCVIVSNCIIACCVLIGALEEILNNYRF